MTKATKPRKYNPEYYQKNRDKIIERNIKYNQDNKDKIAEYRKEYDIKNKLKIKKQAQRRYMKRIGLIE